jgi:hypothetical protein
MGRRKKPRAPRCPCGTCPRCRQRAAQARFRAELRRRLGQELYSLYERARAPAGFPTAAERAEEKQIIRERRDAQKAERQRTANEWRPRAERELLQFYEWMNPQSPNRSLLGAAKFRSVSYPIPRASF